MGFLDKGGRVNERSWPGWIILYVVEHERIRVFEPRTSDVSEASATVAWGLGLGLKGMIG